MNEEQTSEHLESLGLTIESTLESDNFDGRSGDSQWTVTIRRGDCSVETPRQQGCAYRHYCTSGPIQLPFVCEKLTIDWLDRNKRTKPNEPELLSVIGSLLLDTSDIDQPFSDWAESFGYSDDSIKARGMFDTCRDMHFALRRMFTDEELCDLRERYQDW